MLDLLDIVSDDNEELLIECVRDLDALILVRRNLHKYNDDHDYLIRLKDEPDTEQPSE